MAERAGGYGITERDVPKLKEEILRLEREIGALQNAPLSDFKTELARATAIQNKQSVVSALKRVVENVERRAVPAVAVVG